MSAPAVLVAARAKYLDSDAFDLVASSVGSGWVTVGTDPETGLPPKYGTGLSAVTFALRSGTALTNGTSARFPRISATVWAQGDAASHDAEWQARNVSESLITCFDDYANANDPVWSPSVWVAHCRWTGEQAVFEVENKRGMIRADVSFDLEVV